MKYSFILLGLLFFLVSEKSFSQSNFKHKFEKYQIIVNVDGKQIHKNTLGTKCEITFNRKTEIYNLTFKTNNNKQGFQKYKIIEKRNNHNIVIVIGDKRPKALKFMVIDSIESKQKIEFTSINGENLTTIMRIGNNLD